MATKIDFIEDTPEQIDFIEEDPVADLLNIVQQSLGQVPAIQAGKGILEEVLPRSEALRVLGAPSGVVGAAADPAQVLEQLRDPTKKFGADIFAPALETLGIQDIRPTEEPISLQAPLTPVNLLQEIIQRPAATAGLVTEAVTDPLNVALGLASAPVRTAIRTFFKPIAGKLPRQVIKETSKGLAKQLEFKFTQSPIIQETNERITNLVSKMTKAIKQAKPIRAQQEKLFTAERARRFAKAKEVSEATTGEAGFFQELGQLKGELPKSKFEAIRELFTEKNITDLFETIKTHPGLELTDTIAGRQGLRKLLAGSVPTEGELALLKGVFGRELVDTLASKRSLLEQLQTLIPELAGVPRALMSSYDFSMPFRQGIFFATRPKQFFGAFNPMFKAFFSEKQFLNTMEQIVKRPTFQLMRKSKLAITKLDAALGQQEEFFMSNLAERIPIIGKGVRASNRAAVTFLNKLRADVFDDILKNAQKLNISNNRLSNFLGLTAKESPLDNPKFLKDLANMINNATGRGTLPGLERAMVPLANVLFSPRLIASRINLLNPLFYASLDPIVRKEALKSLAGTIALMATTLTLADMAGAEVEKDPRSTDFGKIKIGNTRFDIMGGFQQFIVLYARVLSGKTKTTSTKQLRALGDPKTFKPQTRLSILEKFIANKTAPLISLGLTMLRGKTPVGEDVNLSRELLERFTPFVLQDLFDLVEERGLVEGGVMSIPAFFGVGIQTFDVSKAGRAKKQLTEEVRTQEVLELLGFK